MLNTNPNKKNWPRRISTSVTLFSEQISQPRQNNSSDKWACDHRLAERLPKPWAEFDGGSRRLDPPYMYNSLGKVVCVDIDPTSGRRPSGPEAGIEGRTVTHSAPPLAVLQDAA